MSQQNEVRIVRVPESQHHNVVGLTFDQACHELFPSDSIARHDPYAAS